MPAVAVGHITRHFLPSPLALLNLIVSLADRLVCGVRGHVMVRRYEPGRLSLRCMLCGAETTGWTIGSNRIIRHSPRAGRPARAIVTGERTPASPVRGALRPPLPDAA